MPCRPTSGAATKRDSVFERLEQLGRKYGTPVGDSRVGAEPAGRPTAHT
eukprot:CAMPEP_0174844464 /NCGR_PEP_ID=MMETSP1114-20130205/11113_1 /TAXON_ID=312471 /ORGANISM="Neobodo designis, Strain CCAP 1951/1" /LENGTH=48 /DNA_ID= /DNA_START= /DNA_END= /DNA_ORIENTATION=